MRVAGIGCRAGAPPEALRDALTRAESRGGRVAALATISARAAEAGALNLPLHLVEVAGIATPTQSPRILARYGTGSIAEAAALAACGPGARIIVARVSSACGRATTAIAETQGTP